VAVIERTIQVSYRHRIYFTRRVFDPANVVLRDVLADGAQPEAHKAFVVLDESLARARSELTRAPRIPISMSRKFILTLIDITLIDIPT